ncbi:MAG TPA: hypothetical protein VK892_12265, partial [Pyrinomonadaceae bacterium]|nr:hypothetical protein [Pyrinomonadaceae bacterium]
MKGNMENQQQEKWRTVFLQFLLLAVICLLLGAIDGFRSYVGSYHNGRFWADLTYVMRWDISGWLIWIGFIPLIVWLSRRFPINRNNRLEILQI